MPFAFAGGLRDLPDLAILLHRPSIGGVGAGTAPGWREHFVEIGLATVAVVTPLLIIYFVLLA